MQNCLIWVPAPEVPLSLARARTGSVISTSASRTCHRRTLKSSVPDPEGLQRKGIGASCVEDTGSR
jgi:hypothetical protein